MIYSSMRSASWIIKCLHRRFIWSNLQPLLHHFMLIRVVPSCPSKTVILLPLLLSKSLHSNSVPFPLFFSQSRKISLTIYPMSAGEARLCLPTILPVGYIPAAATQSQASRHPHSQAQDQTRTHLLRRPEPEPQYQAHRRLPL